MNLRSLLFVPADSERKIARALTTDADAVIFDLEDSVSPDRKSRARETLSEVLPSLPADRSWRAFVRVNDLWSGHALSDLRAVVGPNLEGVILPKAQDRQDLTRLDHYLEMAECSVGLPLGQIGILPVVTETAKAVLGLMGPPPEAPTARLLGLTWGGEDLAADLGALTNRRDDGGWDHTFRLARSLCLLNATVAGVPAIDTIHADVRDPEGLAGECRQAKRSGFAGKLAIHPDQPSIINSAFSPTAEELEHARMVVAAFTSGDGAGVASLAGKMLDRPHLLQARQTLGLEPRQS